jgi:pimeloyl-ACP methyl ester carboxylesterase
MPFQEINGIQVYYEVHGEGEVVVLIHHGFGSTAIWNPIYPGLVAEGYKVVIYDRRGYGRSERGAGFREYYESDRYRMDSVKELHALKESLGIGPCHLVGQCEGGVVGIDYTIKHSGDVKTLTVASTQCYGEVTMAELNSSKFASRFEDLDPDIQAKMEYWHGEYGRANYEQFVKYGGGEYGIGHFDLRPVLPFVRPPTLVLYPDRSAIFNVEQAITFYRLLPKGELAVFPKCGHNTYEQRPEDYVRTVIDFLKRNREGASDGRVNTTCLA